MMEIGIEKNLIENYYGKIERLPKVKYDIVNNINEDERIIAEKADEGGKIMNPLSKKDKENYQTTKRGYTRIKILSKNKIYL